MAGGSCGGGCVAEGACMAGGVCGGVACMAGGVRGRNLRDTVNERAVRILLECILVNVVCTHGNFMQGMTDRDFYV